MIKHVFVSRAAILFFLLLCNISQLQIQAIQHFAIHPDFPTKNIGCSFISVWLQLCDVFRSMWQANEDHWPAHSENFGDQIWSLDDGPTGVAQKQQGEPNECALQPVLSLCSMRESILMIYK